jgi:transcriptional regulator with XRE-family HTH domain
MATPRHPRIQLEKLIAHGLRSTEITSRRELEQVCGLAVGYLSHLIAGRIKRPQPEVLRRLANVLHQDIEDYYIAIRMDDGELPKWSRLLAADLGIELLDEDEQALITVAEALARKRRKPDQ